MFHGRQSCRCIFTTRWLRGQTLKSQVKHSRGSTPSSPREPLPRDASSEQSRATGTERCGGYTALPAESSLLELPTSSVPSIPSLATVLSRRTTPASQPTCRTSAWRGGGIARTYAATAQHARGNSTFLARILYLSVYCCLPKYTFVDSHIFSVSRMTVLSTN